MIPQNQPKIAIDNQKKGSILNLIFFILILIVVVDVCGKLGRSNLSLIW